MGADDSYWRDLGHNYTTIPEYFKAQGYESVGMGKIFHPGHSSGTGSRAANASLARDPEGACPPNRCGPCSDDQLFSWSRPFYHSVNQEGSPAGGCAAPPRPGPARARGWGGVFGAPARW